MSVPLRLIVGSEYEPKIKELTLRLTAPNPLPHEAIPIVKEVSVRSCRVMLDENCIPEEGSLLGELWDARYMLLGFIEVPEFVRIFKMLPVPSKRTDALVVHNRLPNWNEFRTSIEKTGIIWKCVNSANLDVIHTFLHSIASEYRKGLVKYCVNGVIFLAHNKPWFYGAGLCDTTRAEAIDHFRDVKALETKAVTTAIDYGASLAWPILQIGVLLERLQQISVNSTIRKSNDWKRAYGFNPSQINAALTLLHRWGAPIAHEFHFPKYWEARNYKVQCSVVTIALEQMRKENIVGTREEKYSYYGLTRWGKTIVREVYENVLRNYDHQTYAGFFEVLQRRVDDIVVRDYKQVYNASKDYIRLAKHRESYVAA